jgi:hypothetical protein
MAIAYSLRRSYPKGEREAPSETNRERVAGSGDILGRLIKFRDVYTIL